MPDRFSAVTHAPPGEHTEAMVTQPLRRKNRTPSDPLVWAALGSIGLSAVLQILGRPNLSTFVGQWAPTFLLFGLYRKISSVRDLYYY
jgi:hypothetical protein